MTKQLRTSLADEMDCLYLVHAPVGTINVSHWGYHIAGFVSIRGEDESKKYRFLIFAEEEIRSFPLEVRRKKPESSKEKLGFKPTTPNETE